MLTARPAASPHCLEAAAVCRAAPKTSRDSTVNPASSESIQLAAAAASPESPGAAGRVQRAHLIPLPDLVAAAGARLRRTAW